MDLPVATDLRRPWSWAAAPLLVLALACTGEEAFAPAPGVGLGRVLHARLPAARRLEPAGDAGARLGRGAFTGRDAQGRLALFDAAGRRRLRAPERAHDLVAGHLDADGALDLVMGLPKREGLRRLGARGETVWTRPDVDPWQVALAGARGGPAAQIVHSNRQGAFVVRDAQGRVQARFHARRPGRYFALAEWQPGSTWLLQRREDGVDLYTLAGVPVTRLPLSLWNEDGRVEAVAFDPRGDGRRWLAVLDHPVRGGPSVLSVFDGRRRRVFEEVVLDGCAGLGTLARGGRSELLVGCGAAIWRYGTALPRSAHAPLTVAALRAQGDALGPLRFGDSRERVAALRTLLPGHRCRLRACDASYVRIGGRDYMLVPEYHRGGLARVALLALPEPLDSYGNETQAAWLELVRFISAQAGRPNPGAAGFPSARRVKQAPAHAGWRTVGTHSWTSAQLQVDLGVATVDDPGAVQYVAYASFAPAGVPAAPAR
jgi:hypothetical protein